MAWCEHEAGFCEVDCIKDGTPECPFYDLDDLYRDLYGIDAETEKDGQVRLDI